MKPPRAAGLEGCGLTSRLEENRCAVSPPPAAEESSGAPAPAGGLQVSHASSELHGRYPDRAQDTPRNHVSQLQRSLRHAHLS